MTGEDASIFDVAIIGGGVNGCGIARDAAGRGAKVLLLEAGDLAQGTSSASTKLIHGGLRYLEHYEFGLVREALSERERLWGIAPHIIWPMRFVLPHVAGLRPRWLLRLGLFIYDHIGGRKLLPAARSIDLRRHPAGAPLKQQFGPAFEYSDGWVDDARLVVLNARDAADRGAEVLTRCPAQNVQREDGLWRIDTPRGSFFARILVNAAGPGVFAVPGLAKARHNQRLRLVRGSHIVVRKLFDHPYAYFFQLPDGRIFFAIPYQEEFTLIGTTDRDHEGGPPRPSEEEIAYLCEGASRYFERPVTPSDVIWSYSGLRPLIGEGSGKPEAATRGYKLELSPPSEGAPLLTIFGGKITTYRHLAEDAVDLLGKHLAVLSRPGWTGRRPLPGGDFPLDGVDQLTNDLLGRFPFLEPAWARRMARAYGTQAQSILGDATNLAECGKHFGHGFTEREARYLIDREWAQTSEDILWRRTKLGLSLSTAEQAELDNFMQRGQIR